MKFGVIIMKLKYKKHHKHKHVRINVKIYIYSYVFVLKSTFLWTSFKITPPEHSQLFPP
jgi:hypothetical protein